MTRVGQWLFIIGSIIIGLAPLSAIDHPEDFVNLLAGTFTDGNVFSTGNTLPLVGRPWGFNHWAPQTRDGSRNTGSWWFKGSDHQFTWLRCTHQPSPWIGDWGWFLFGPQIGNAQRNPTFYWEPRAAVIKPHLFDATFSPHGIRTELTPTMHGAMLRVTFPTNAQVGREVDRKVCFAELQELEHGVADKIPFITGKSLQVKIDRMLVVNFALYMRAESESALAEMDHEGDMMCFRYRGDAPSVTVRIATSLISVEQAQVSLRRELELSRGFDDLAAEAKREWNQLLRRVSRRVADAAEYDVCAVAFVSPSAVCSVYVGSLIHAVSCRNWFDTDPSSTLLVTLHSTHISQLLICSLIHPCTQLLTDPYPYSPACFLAGSLPL